MAKKATSPTEETATPAVETPATDTPVTAPPADETSAVETEEELKAPTPEPEAQLQVKILVNRTRIGKWEYAAGHTMLLPRSKAKLLEEEKKAEIIGI